MWWCVYLSMHVEKLTLLIYTLRHIHVSQGFLLVSFSEINWQGMGHLHITLCFSPPRPGSRETNLFRWISMVTVISLLVPHLGPISCQRPFQEPLLLFWLPNLFYLTSFKLTSLGIVFFVFDLGFFVCVFDYYCFFCLNLCWNSKHFSKWWKSVQTA